MKRTVVAWCMAALVVPVVSAAGVYPPRPGVRIPDAYYERVRKDRTAFQFQHAWIGKTRRIRENRERYVAQHGFYRMNLVPPAERPQLAVGGTFRIPVLVSKFSNTGADPYPTSTLQTKLFDGPFSPMTMTQFYQEISYGNLTVNGDVIGWTQLSQADTYYEGGTGCNGLCGTSKVGQFITETLNAVDPTVDFGQYDNDGPDGIPNSGDDDGFVDFVAFVHPEAGGECGNNNIWSHRWVVSGWTGSPYTTNDPAAGGGFIKIQDYTIQPAYNCGGATPIDIGVFCHEFGHAFGLPDLYDTDGGSEGIGEWGLMGAGSWQITTSPAHMCTWSKNELGWINLVDVGGKATGYIVSNIEFDNMAYRLRVEDERWRRMTTCAIAGSYSMRCGLLASEAAARNWANGDGYGNSWIERVDRTFTYNGTGPVTLQYDYSFDSESGYDYTYGRIDVRGTVSTFATYTGTGSGTAVIDLTPYLSGQPAGTPYTIIFQFESDQVWSDEDGSGGFNSTCGPFVFDNVSVTGGGESYFTDFEAREDGWAPDVTSPAEFFLVANRQPVGSDTYVNGGQGGLAIWHINQDVTREGQAGNTGGTAGTANQRPHGVALVEADGLNQLLNGVNRGDGGDVFPGTTNNTSLTNATVPSSKGSSGLPNNVAVTGIPASPANGNAMTVTMRAGFSPPDLAGATITPSSGDNNAVVSTSIRLVTSSVARGATADLVNGPTTIPAVSVTWVGRDYLLADFDLNGKPGGLYDLIVTQPDGACDTLAGAFTVNAVATGVGDTPRRTALHQNYPNPFNPTTVIPFEIARRTHVTLRIYNVAGQLVRTLVDDALDARAYRISWDGRNDAGHGVSSGVYFYRLEAGDYRAVRKLVLMK